MRKDAFQKASSRIVSSVFYFIQIASITLAAADRAALRSSAAA